MNQFRIINSGYKLYSLQFTENNGNSWTTLFQSSKVECEREKKRYEQVWGK